MPFCLSLGKGVGDGVDVPDSSQSFISKVVAEADADILTSRSVSPTAKGVTSL